MKAYIVLVLLFLLALNLSAGEMIKLDRPIRSYSVILTENGFSPENLVAYEGETLKINVTATSGDKGCLFLRSHNVFIPAQRGKIHYGSTQLNEQGRFEFYCPSLKHKGTLTVLETPQKEVKREIASEKPEVNYWIPRDYD
jgi:hypothetical protein